MKFKVYDLDGDDVTDTRPWFVDSHGTLHFIENGRIVEAGDDYWYSPE